MMPKITKAIIPAAGLGTRMLPATKAVPKIMLPIVDKPAIQYIVEEAAASGIRDILVIVHPLDKLTERHFCDCIAGVNIDFIVQAEQRGLGHAVLQVKSFAAGEAAAVMYADDVIIGDDPCIGQLCRVYEKYGKLVAGIKQVPREHIHRYSSLKVSPLPDESNVYDVTDMVEKAPRGQEFSLFSILGRCVLPPEVFDILEGTQPGAGGEIQLTDAMKVLAVSGRAVGVDYTGRYYDIGNKLGMLKANVELGLEHPELGAAFREYLRAAQGSCYGL